MTDYKLVTNSIVDELAQFIREVDGNNRMGAGALAEKICERFRVDAPAVQGEPVASAPVAAQHRFRHPQKSLPDWSVWQPATITLDRPSWYIDSQGFEVEYRLLYDAPQPAEQQSAPDVAVLVEALTELCDEIDKHAIHAAISKTSISWFKRKARNALAAHRKQGGKAWRVL